MKYIETGIKTKKTKFELDSRVLLFMQITEFKQIFYIKKDLERETRFELATSTLARLRSTN